jgi:tetratricopeptide (TPR) repeat protein
MGLIEFQSGNVASSIKLYKQAIKLQPSSYSAHYNLALSYLREHHLQDGKLELERAVRLDPSQADAAYDLGVVLLELGDPSAAIVHLERSRKLNPHRPDVSFNLVRANLEAGKISEARGEAEAAVVNWAMTSNGTLRLHSCFRRMATRRTR